MSKRRDYRGLADVQDSLGHAEEAWAVHNNEMPVWHQLK